MIVTAIKTDRINPKSIDLLALLDSAITDMPEKSVLAITSKIVSLCEGNVMPLDAIAKEELVIQESDRYLPATLSRYGHHFTITRNTLIPMAGVDESNGGNNFILWPKDAQATANEVRAYLQKRFGLKDAGVVITDSTCHPLRRGTLGILLAHSGFAALTNYIGKPDLFGRPFAVSQADIAGGLAAAAVLQMGEGSEQTPLARLTNLPFVTFQDHDPSAEELSEIHIPPEEDLFAPFLESVEWKQGKRQQP
jgi:putative folate metabolism gamma-glutamate ligase